LDATFVLDTCVLLADPRSLLRFDEHDVVLPLVVVEELDRKKTRMDEVGSLMPGRRYGFSKSSVPLVTAGSEMLLTSQTAAPSG